MEPSAVPALEHVSRHQDAELHELRDNLLRAAGIEPRVLPKVHGTGKPVMWTLTPEIAGRRRSPRNRAALRAYVGQNDAIDGTWDPMTCTLTKSRQLAADQPDPTAEPEPEGDPEAQHSLQRGRPRGSRRRRKHARNARRKRQPRRRRKAKHNL